MFRFTVESALLLAVAVTVFRAFFAEGYMISTGSMAPTLLGYHHRLTCPACRFAFERGATGVPSGGQVASAAHDIASDPWADVSARCPNCGTAVATGGQPRNEGDQLMVHKHEFAWRAPHRWEVAVFRNPEQPMQAYVKRVAGLPGETIDLRDGDLYADGVLQRKPLATQLAMRVPVCHHDFEPATDDPDWRPRWRSARLDSVWTTDGPRFHCASNAESAADAFDWVEYRHWIRAGGRHVCRVGLDEWPNALPEPTDARDGFHYHEAARCLVSCGALPAEVVADWMTRTRSETLRSALLHLYEASHSPPLTDICGYNHPESAGTANPVHDLLLEVELLPRSLTGEFAITLHDGCQELRCVCNLAHSTLRLTSADGATVYREGSLPTPLVAGEPVVLTFSLFDRQALVGVGGVEVLPPLRYSGTSQRPPLPSRPARFGARGADVVVSHVRLDRDVYYTAAEEDARYVIPAGRYFVLGDNSPVSLDSRAWSDPTVSAEMLIGKPFVVHLPSQPYSITWGGETTHLRLPDPSRMRFIE
jgi:signal peptidase I